MEIGWSLLWFIIAVSLLVTVHEFGHYWVARKLGFKVLRFSVGFGKPLYKRVGPGARSHGIRHRRAAARRLRAHARRARRRSSPRGSAACVQQQATLAANPGHAGGSRGEHPVRHRRSLGHVLEQRRQVANPVVGDVLLGSPAATAGLRSGDQFVSIGGEPVKDHGDVVLGLLDMLSDEGSTDIDVRGRDGQLRHLRRESFRTLTSGAS